ncbi:MAG: hypothetical protein H6703_11195 [Myxococcales bacterium]|nr:hypothetical protein [Myxococcales bacterium]
MAQQIDYKVTRSGREVYGGALPGLVEAAAAGQIRANDLVYDPTGDRWVFARNLPALAGFALRGRRAYGTEAGDRPGRITLEGRGLERQQERRRRAVRAVLLLSVLAVTLALVMMVPAGTDKRQLSEFIEGRISRWARWCRRGRGAARAAGRRQARRRARGRGGGRCDGRDGRGGRAAGAMGGAAAGAVGGGAVGGVAGAAAMGGAAMGAAAAGPALGGAAMGGAAGGAAMAGAAGGAAMGAFDAAAMADVGGDAGPAAARRPIGPPAELVFDYARRDAPGVFVEPTAEERARYAARYTSEGMRALAEPNPPPGDARLAELLAARHRAEFAKLNLEALDGDHPDLPQVDRLIAELEAAFTAACQPLYGERFCGLKLLYPDWPDAVVERVAGGQVVIGMTAEQAREAWGRPTRFRRDGVGRRFCYDALCARSLKVVDQVVVEVGG